MALGGILLAALLGPRWLYGSSGPQEVRPRDRDVLFTIDELGLDGAEIEDLEHLSRTGSGGWLASTHLDYRGDLDLPPTLIREGPRRRLQMNWVYVRSFVEAFPRVNASTQLKSDLLFDVIREHLADLTPEEAETHRIVSDKALDLGDASHLVLLGEGEALVGFRFLVQVDARLLHVVVDGWCFEDPAQAPAFLAPHVERLHRYEP